MSIAQKINWQLPKLIDYWDQRVKAIDTLSRRRATFPESRRAKPLKEIRRLHWLHWRISSFPNK